MLIVQKLKNVSVNNMLFFLSSKISIRRKVFYSGLMLTVASLVFFDMSYSTDFYIMEWIIAGFICGLSMILLSIIFQNTKKYFAIRGNTWIYFLMSLLPIFFTIIGFVFSTFLNFESFAEEYLVKNNLNIILGIPLMLFCCWRLLIKDEMTKKFKS